MSLRSSFYGNEPCVRYFCLIATLSVSVILQEVFCATEKVKEGGSSKEEKKNQNQTDSKGNSTNPAPELSLDDVLAKLPLSSDTPLLPELPELPFVGFDVPTLPIPPQLACNPPQGFQQPYLQSQFYPEQSNAAYNAPYSLYENPFHQQCWGMQRFPADGCNRHAGYEVTEFS